MLNPPDYLRLSLKVGAVFKMKAPELITTEVPHYFVVIAIDENDNYLFMSTSKKHTPENYIKKRKWSVDTLATIKPSDSNGLTVDSYFNCNEKYNITTKELIKKRTNNSLSYEGRISEVEYGDIVCAINQSFVLAIPSSLLNYGR